MSSLSAVGLMSGTSYDGVDVALIDTDGEEIGRLGPTGYRPYGEEERALLRRAIASATNLGDRADRPGILAEAEAPVTGVHAGAGGGFPAANRRAGRGRGGGGGGANGGGGGRAGAGAPVLRAAAAETARPQRLPPMGSRPRRTRGQEHRGRRRHPHRDHRRCGRPRRRGSAAPTGE